MDLINWSLNAIDTIFSTRSLGSGEPVCPDGTFAAGYTMDAWERWRIVCLAALSVEDIEDIYLFGTMITGLLLIGLGFALGYRRIQKTGTAVHLIFFGSPTSTGLGQGRCWKITPAKSTAVRRSCVPPPLYRH